MLQNASVIALLCTNASHDVDFVVFAHDLQHEHKMIFQNMLG